MQLKQLRLTTDRMMYGYAMVGLAITAFLISFYLTRFQSICTEVTEVIQMDKTTSKTTVTNCDP
jgi:hypothetical protein